MLISRRHWMKNCALAGAVVTATTASVVSAEDQAADFTDAQLEQLIEAQGLTPTKVEQRYDFGFKATLEQDTWELSMSAVLSQDGQSVWVMAWLDELPKSSADVPRTALLRLLSANDKLGNGKFFAYIAANRRFVLQRVLSTEGLDSASFRTALQDLGASVVETHPQWYVANWKSGGASKTQSAVNETKYQEPVNR